jgi:hypothetical protein
MAAGPVQKRLTLKRAEFMNCGAKPNLQQFVGGALGELSTIGARREQLTATGSYYRLLLTHRKHKGLLCGVLATYERGSAQLTVAENDNAKTLAIERVLPPEDASGQRKQFLEGVCYFGILDNHVVLCQSQAVRARAIEEHLNWLVGRAELWQDDSSVALSDHVSKVTVDRIRAKGVRQIRIGAPLFAATASTLGVKTKTEVFTVRSAAVDALKALLGNHGDRLQFKDALDGHIDVELRISFKRRTGEQAQRLLQNIALAARNVDDEDLSIQLSDGDTVKGKELKHSKVITIDAYDRIPNETTLFDEMHSWLTDGLSSRQIDP